MIRPPPRSPLFPYTTLSRSRQAPAGVEGPMKFRIDHVQLAIPPGGEERARAFYAGVLGLVEEPKPEPMRACGGMRSEEHTSELQSPCNLVCRLLLEKKKRQR